MMPRLRYDKVVHLKPRSGDGRLQIGWIIFALVVPLISCAILFWCCRVRILPRRRLQRAAAARETRGFIHCPNNNNDNNNNNYDPDSAAGAGAGADGYYYTTSLADGGGTTTNNDGSQYSLPEPGVPVPGPAAYCGYYPTSHGGTGGCFPHSSSSPPLGLGRSFSSRDSLGHHHQQHIWPGTAPQIPEPPPPAATYTRRLHRHYHHSRTSSRGSPSSTSAAPRSSASSSSSSRRPSGPLTAVLSSTSGSPPPTVPPEPEPEADREGDSVESLGPYADIHFDLDVDVASTEYYDDQEMIDAVAYGRHVPFSAVSSPPSPTSSSSSEESLGPGKYDDVHFDLSVDGGEEASSSGHS